jgi:hypothetical protein
MKEDWQSFDRRHGHWTIEFSFDILRPILRWFARRREEKKRQDKVRQESHARALKAEEFRKSEIVRQALAHHQGLVHQMQQAENIRFRKGRNLEREIIGNRRTGRHPEIQTMKTTINERRKTDGMDSDGI